MKLPKVYRILKFKQSNWLEEYAEFNTKKRQESTDEFNKIFFKLLIHCVYGKSIENIRKRINVRLINDSKTYFISQIIHYFISFHKKYLIKSLLQFIK